ncbi:MAG TPA: hypothetical protein VGL38_07230 [bacterium]|jgi:hypothetical protein
MTVPIRRRADFRDNPILFVELAHEWAAGGPRPEPQYEAWLRELPRPIISKPALAREALWGTLSYPQRAQSLEWLDSVGLLQEILPVWDGDPLRRALRLQAADEVRRERWSGGLSDTAFDWLSVYQDQRVDGRLGGWAMSGLTTLLLIGDNPPDIHAARVAADLKTLGANDGERERVLTAIREAPELFRTITTCSTPARTFSPTVIVAVLSSLMIEPDISEETMHRWITCADRLLTRYAAPDHAPGRLR